MAGHPILTNQHSQGWHTVVKWIKPEMLLKKYWIIPVNDKDRSVSSSLKVNPCSMHCFRNHWSLMVASVPAGMFGEGAAPDEKM